MVEKFTAVGKNLFLGLVAFGGTWSGLAYYGRTDSPAMPVDMQTLQDHACLLHEETDAQDIFFLGCGGIF